MTTVAARTDPPAFKTHQEPTCPVCGSTKFGDYRARKLVRCAGCGSKERTRFMYVVLRDLLPPPNGLPVVQCAPEQATNSILADKFPATYQPADFDPSLYPWVKQKMMKVDLTRPLDYFEPNSVQGFVHSHVLEHIPTDLHRTIKDMNTAIAPGGFHTFCVPFFSKYYREDMDPNLSHSERDRLFGQFDHVRSFGTLDSDERLLSLFEGFDRLNMAAVYPPEKLQANAVPIGAATSMTAHTIFHFVKRS